MEQDLEEGDAVRAPAARRKRRRTGEIVNRIIDAAFQEFGQHGYSNTTTAAIARRAEVAEALIFTHFGSKAHLFQKVIFRPLDNHLATFSANHQMGFLDSEQKVKESRAFVSDFLDFIRPYSGMFKSLVANEAYGTHEGGAFGLSGLQDYFDAMAAKGEATCPGKVPVPPRLMARISFAALLGCILFDDWLFPQGLADEARIHEAVCDFIMEGLNANPGRGE